MRLRHGTLYTDPLTAFVIVVIVMVTGAAWFNFEPGELGERAPAAPGKIVFEDTFHDFGQVTEGDVVRHTFRFRNDGAGSVKIVKTETSCGCTTANGALREYAPGESGEMEVVVDTQGKKGIIVKNVTVFYAHGDTPSKELALTMKLMPPPHPKVDNVVNINADPQCKSCHLDAGLGQKGVFLFHRVCAQCHGKKGVGASAPALNDGQWSGAGDDTYIRSTIADGLPGRGMPPFVAGVSPALDAQQVESLVEYIRVMEKEQRE